MERILGVNLSGWFIPEPWVTPSLYAATGASNAAELQEAIEALTGGKTIIMIAHRLKTVRNADQILVLDHGEIVQHGTHDQLIGQQGIYALSLIHI